MAMRKKTQSSEKGTGEMFERVAAEVRRELPPQRIEIHDTRGVVLASLAEALVAQSRAIESIAHAAAVAPEYQSTEKIGNSI